MLYFIKFYISKQYLLTIFAKNARPTTIDIINGYRFDKRTFIVHFILLSFCRQKRGPVHCNLQYCLWGVECFQYYSICCLYAVWLHFCFCHFLFVVLWTIPEKKHPVFILLVTRVVTNCTFPVQSIVNDDSSLFIFYPLSLPLKGTEYLFGSLFSFVVICRFVRSSMLKQKR